MRRNIVYLPSRGMRLYEIGACWHFLHVSIVLTYSPSVSIRGFAPEYDLSRLPHRAESNRRHPPWGHFPRRPPHRNRYVNACCLFPSTPQLTFSPVSDKAELEHLVSPDAPCLFCPEDTPPPASAANEFDDVETTSVDFTSYVNQVHHFFHSPVSHRSRLPHHQTPITVSPKQPLEIVMQIFKRIGCALLPPSSLPSPGQKLTSFPILPYSQSASNPHRAVWPPRWPHYGQRLSQVYPRT